jgi:beta-lactamase superfamily II metal-dependent hydrolase
MVVSCEDFDFFVGGDLSGSNTSSYVDVESIIAEDVGEVDVYRVNHHGSYYSSNTFFLENLMPQAAVISCGSNSYGHPDSDAMARITATGADLYQTENGSGRIRDGNIVITYYAGSFNIKTRRYDRNYIARNNTLGIVENRPN